MADDGAHDVAAADRADANGREPAGGWLAYPAGAAADIFDRRQLLIFWQSWMLASVAILSALTLAGIVSPGPCSRSPFY